MSKLSKTARASMAQTVGQKVVISDETYVKNLRDDLANKRYVAQEGARALLRAHDVALTTIGELNEQVNLLQIDSKSQENLIKDLIASNDKLKAEIAAAQEIFGNAAKSTEYSTLESLEAEAKNNHD